MLPSSMRRQGVSSVHPQRYQGLDPTFARGTYHIILYLVHPRRFARNSSHERSCFWWKRPRLIQKNRSCSSSTPHIMGRSPGRPVRTRGCSFGLFNYDSYVSFRAIGVIWGICDLAAELVCLFFWTLWLVPYPVGPIIKTMKTI